MAHDNDEERAEIARLISASAEALPSVAGQKLFSVLEDGDDADRLESVMQSIQPPERLAAALHWRFSLLDDCTPFLYAAKRGRTRCLELLLPHAGDINRTRASHGKTALHLAAFSGGSATVELLLSCGADVRAVDDYNWNSVHSAAHQLNDHSVELLVRADAGAAALPGGSANRTPLHIAAASGTNVAVVRRLLAAAPETVRARDTALQTPLHLAAASWRSPGEFHVGARRAMVKLLLEYGGAGALLERDCELRTPRDVIRDGVQQKNFDQLIAETLPLLRQVELISALRRDSTSALSVLPRDIVVNIIGPMITNGELLNAWKLNQPTVESASESPKSNAACVIQ